MFVTYRELKKALEDYHLAQQEFNNAAPGFEDIAALKLEAARQRYNVLLAIAREYGLHNAKTAERKGLWCRLVDWLKGRRVS